MSLLSQTSRNGHSTLTGPQPLDSFFITPQTFLLQAFACANNISEYEALVVGLELAIEIHLKNLTVHGDSHKKGTENLQPHLIPYACKQDEAAAPTVPYPYVQDQTWIPACRRLGKAFR